MPWYDFWSSKNPTSSNTPTSDALSTTLEKVQNTLADTTSQTPPPTLLTTFTTPSTLLSTALLTSILVPLLLLSRRLTRRIPTAPEIPQRYILPQTQKRSLSLFGPVTSVGDADNFRLYHTPLGRLALWSILRPIPSTPATLKNQTIHVRLAGIDAPELSHFGRPAQPYSKDAMTWLTNYLTGRRVRVYCRRKDQYGRVVGTAYVWRWLRRRDVGLEMLRAGWAGVYEAKSGVEFGGEAMEKRYRGAEELARRKGRGMWVGGSAAGVLETPREYKNRFREGNTGTGGGGGG